MGDAVILVHCILGSATSSLCVYMNPKPTVMYARWVLYYWWWKFKWLLSGLSFFCLSLIHTLNISKLKHISTYLYFNLMLLKRRIGYFSQVSEWLFQSYHYEMHFEYEFSFSVICFDPLHADVQCIRQVNSFKFFRKSQISIAIFRFSKKNAFKGVQTSLVLVQ